MRPELWGRLDRIGRRLGIGNKLIIVPRYFDESSDDAEEKLERWIIGEDVDDISTRPIAGDELVIMVRYFGRNRNGSEVTVEEYQRRLRPY